MNLMDILSPETIVLPLKTVNKINIIQKLVQTLYTAEKISDLEKVLKAVLDREAVMSTGVGEGVAIPHGKSDAAPNIVAALGITEAPVDFEAIDNKPVQLIWLLVGPPGKTGPHLKALSRISRLMHQKDFRDRLIAAPSSEAALHEIATEEQKLF
jgi:fructose-specific phosphotransferase system IIA component